MKNKILYICLAIIIILIGSIFIIKNILFKKDISSTNTTDSIDISINTDDGDEKIDWSLYKDTSYELNNSITITESGTYNLTGTIKNGLITIDANLGNVKLILNNVNITNNSGPAIFVKNAEDVVIELVSDSKNYLSDGSSYSGFEIDEVGVIYSHDDLTLQGNGYLEINSNNEDGIVSSDDLKIVSGNYVINSKDDGIRGKDSVYIKDGNFTIISLGDGIKSTNDSDSEKGYILIENGVFNIESTLDGIQSETKLLIQNGTFNIKTGNGSTITSQNNEWGHWNNIYSNNTESAKGLKSTDNLVIENGTFIFDTSDDAIHCNNYIGIKNGTITIESGDDGIHADTEIIIDEGTININKSYEGLEAAKITINNGNINIVSSDDGINIAGGNDSSSTGRPGENNHSSNTNNILTINNGNIYINATGDGIDVNGSAYINDGFIQVDGPTNSGNGALDYDRLFEVNNGTLLAGGESGMLQGLSSSSKLYNITITFNLNYGSNDLITITDSNNNEIISYKSNKSYSSLVVASPKLKKGESYTIKVNDTTYESFTIQNITTTIGNNRGNFFNPGNDRHRR